MQLFFSSNYPYKSKQISNKIHTVTLGIGGNIGNVKRRFNKLFLALQKDCRFHVLQTTPLLQNPPFGYLEQDDFLNGLIVIKTNLSPIYLLNQIQRYENRFGRKRSFQDAPRTLDIDIIFYGNKQIKHKRLIVPHKNWKERDSVVIPLNFLNTTTKKGKECIIINDSTTK